MSWTWRYQDAGGAELDEPTSESFASRGDAESWLGEHWPSIAARGARRAQLLNGVTPVGRSLTLREPGDAAAPDS